MHFIKNRKKNSFSFFGFAGALLFIALLCFATVGAASSDNNPAESNRFAFLQNNPATFFFGNDARQSSFAFSLNGRAGQAAEIVGSEVFEQFDAWVKTYVANGYRVNREQSAQGERLASERQQLLKRLIETNPKAALRKALSAEEIEQMPEYITKHTEKHISTNGDFLVYAIDSFHSDRKSGSKMSGSHTRRTIVIGESRYKASVYGRRLGMTTKLNIPLQGIIIDDVMAVDESPARILDKGAGRAEVGGEQKNFASEAEMERFIDEQIEWESKIGPVRGSAGKKSSATPRLAPEQTAAWTLGVKKLLVLRVDFSDKPGVPLDFSNQPFTVERARSLYTEVNQFFEKNSYNKTSIQMPVVTEVIRLPQTLAYYREQYTQSGDEFRTMINDARAAARAFNPNYDFNNYDFDVVAFTYTPLPGGVVAISSIGDKGSVLTGDAFSLREAAHELGHNYGLEHASLWYSTDGTPHGAGFSVEYGDDFDMMGLNGTATTHFNAYYKRRLAWLTEADIQTITPTGTYQSRSYPINAQDFSTTGKRALKINRLDGRNYWVEFRQLIAGNAMNGALIHWDSDGQSSKSQLLDMIPGGNLSDAPLLVGGQPFRDDTYGIKITVESKSALELNVKVETDLPPANCTYSLSPESVSVTGFNQTITSTNVTTGPNCPWTAISNDGWLTVADGVNRKGSGSVSITATHNAGAGRTGTITIGGKIFSVIQASGRCIDSFNPTSFSIPASGGTLNYTHTCNEVTPTSVDSDWININTSPITVSSNSGPARTGNVTLAVKDSNGAAYTINLTVNQAGQGVECTYSLNPTSQSFNASAGVGVFSVTPTNAGCSSNYSAVSNHLWITVNNPSGQTGGNINYTVAQNTTSVSRTGTVTVSIPNAGNRIFTINQAAAAACSFSINPLSRNFALTGGAASFTLTASDSSCAWSAAASDSWINITGNTSGTGSATINFNVSASNVAARTGTVTVGGQVFNVSQDSGCVYSVQPSSSAVHNASGASGSFGILTGSGCNWTVASNASWVAINSNSFGSGNGTISYTVAANTGSSARTGTIIAGGQTFTVNQAASCVYSLSRTNISFGNSAGSDSVNVTSGAGCTWTAVSNSTWITVTSGGNGNGSGAVTFSVAANTGPARDGTIMVAGQTVTVSQASGCAFLLSSPNSNFGDAGGNGSLSVTSGAGCTWTTTTNSPSWITFTSGTNGNGNGTINFSVAANSGQARTATITVSGQTFTVNQMAGCIFSLSAANASFETIGGNGAIFISSSTGCAWTAVSNDSWISITGGANGTGNGTVTFSVAANTDAARTGTITLGGQTFTITQSAVIIPTISITSVAKNEGNTGTSALPFDVNLSAPSTRTVSVNFATANGTAIAGEDYIATNGTLTFAPNETSKSIVVSIIGDTIIEPNETFTVNLSSAVNATISRSVGEGTIGGDDAGGSLRFSPGYTINENTGNAIITVTRTGGAASGVAVNYSTSNGTATSGQDYTAVSGTLNFSADETSKTFTVPITNDAISEPNETVNLTLSNTVGGTLGTPATAVLTIIDDEGAPALSINNVSANEGNSGTTAFNFTVSLSGASSQTVTVNYATADGTATAPTDYQAASGSLSFAPGDTTIKTVTVLVNGNVRLESNKIFTVNLTNAVNAAIANGQGIGAILNDDVADQHPPCTYSISTTNITVGAEASSGNSFSVSTQGGVFGNCYFSASTTSSFITITSSDGNSGVGGTVRFSVAANNGAARTGTISVMGQTVTVNQAAVTTAPRKVLFDFDGDGKSDVSVFRPDNGVWYQLNSTSGFSAAQFGIPTDKIAPADFDGDGKTDFAVFRDGNWFLLRSRDGFASIPFGSPGDVPEPADFDGDGRAELVVFRPSNGTWYSLNLVNNAFSAVQFGTSEDKPVTADYDGDGKADQAVYRPSNGVWYMLRSRDGFLGVQFGIATDKPAVGDFDGDGRADQAVYRAESGIWYILRSTQGFTSMPFGISTDIPAPGDFDGDGKTDIAVFRPENGTWYQMRSVQGFGAVQFGARGDKPIPNSLVR